MNMLQIGLVSVIGVFLAIQLKGTKAEYGMYLCLVVSVLLCFCVLDQLKVLQEAVKHIKKIVVIDRESIAMIIKMIGVTYISEFASSICKDAGYQTIALQIEMISKLTILAMGMPVLFALLEILQEF